MNEGYAANSIVDFRIVEGNFVGLAAIKERSEISRDFFDLQAADELGEVFGMGADVAHACRRAGALRISAPFRPIHPTIFPFHRL